MNGAAPESHDLRLLLHGMHVLDERPRAPDIVRTGPGCLSGSEE
jgi:hypothetical protein